MASVRTHLWFGNNQAVEAAKFYASVFPDIPVCNINATVLSVAVKAADLIAEDMRG